MSLITFTYDELNQLSKEIAKKRGSDGFDYLAATSKSVFDQYIKTNPLPGFASLISTSINALFSYTSSESEKIAEAIDESIIEARKLLTNSNYDLAKCDCVYKTKSSSGAKYCLFTKFEIHSIHCKSPSGWITY